MSRRLFLRDFVFTKSGHKEYPCSLESPVAEKPKCPSALSSGFCESRLRVSRFQKSSYKGYLCPLEPPVAEMSEMPKYPGVQSTAHNDPWDRRFQSNRDFTISRFGILKDKSLCLSNSRYPKCRNGHRETLAANLLAAPLDPTPAGFRCSSSRILHRPFRSLNSPHLDLRSIKVCAPSSNRTIHGNFHSDPTLDDVLPPEILLDSDLEYFLSLRRLSLRSF
jgi:hypothetical protein